MNTTFTLPFPFNIASFQSIFHLAFDTASIVWRSGMKQHYWRRGRKSISLGYLWHGYKPRIKIDVKTLPRPSFVALSVLLNDAKEYPEVWKFKENQTPSEPLSGYKNNQLLITLSLASRHSLIQACCWVQNLKEDLALLADKPGQNSCLWHPRRQTLVSSTLTVKK